MVTTTVPNDACVSHPPKLVSFYRYWSYLIVSMFDKLIGAYSKFKVRKGYLVQWKCQERAISPLPYSKKGGPWLRDEGKILIGREDIKAKRYHYCFSPSGPGSILGAPKNLALPNLFSKLPKN